MWELDCEEGWVLKNWCFWTVVLDKTLASPLDCKEIQSVHSEGDQPWDFFGRTDAKAETPVFWPPHAKRWPIGKDFDAGRDWGQGENGMTEDEMAGWLHLLDGLEFKWTPGFGDGQAGLACCDSWGHRVRHDWMAEMNWTEHYFLSNVIRNVERPCLSISLSPAHIPILFIHTQFASTNFYGLNVCPIPEFIYWILNPQCYVIWKWGLFKTFRLWEWSLSW